MIIFTYDEKLKTNGSWCGVRKRNGSYTAHCKCPNGHISSLEDHEIDYDGDVYPSVVCSWEGCGFHDMVRLNGWISYMML